MSVSDAPASVSQFACCIDDMVAWMSASWLRLNPTKTEVLWIGWGPSRDVNFGYFQKSIIVLKKLIFFRVSNLGLGVAIWLCRRLLCNVPRTMRCWCSRVGGPVKRPLVPVSLISTRYRLLMNFSASKWRQRRRRNAPSPRKLLVSCLALETQPYCCLSRRQRGG